MQKIKSVLSDYRLLLDSVPALVTSIFILSTVMMNIMAGKIIFSIGNVAFTGGFILSAMPFLCMDCTAKRFGARAAIMLNILSALGNIFAVVMFAIVAVIPTEQDYSAYNTVIGGVWFISVSSIIAFVVSGVANSLINAAIGKLFGNRTSAKEFYTRSFASTFVGQALDNFIFLFLTYGVFAPIFWHMDPMPFLTCLVTAIIGGLIELLVEVVLGPCGFAIVKDWEARDIGRAYIDAHPEINN